jgi:hypothetical protein
MTSQTAKVHQWLGRCPVCYELHNDLDELLALNMREKYPDPGTSTLAIRDVDEPKFHVPSRDFDVYNSAWWAWRVIEWGLDPRNDGYAQRLECMNRAHEAMVRASHDIRVGDLFA